MEFYLIGILQILVYSFIMIAIGRYFAVNTTKSLIYGWIILMTVAYLWFTIGMTIGDDPRNIPYYNNINNRIYSY